MSKKDSLAFVFPGQGSQKVGMLNDYLASSEIVKNTFLEASEALGFDLLELTQEGPADTLNLTENAQPALVTSSVALWRLWRDQCEVTPAVVAGHSLGEWSALVVANVIDLCDAVKLVKLRGQYMQSAVPVGVGAMAAIIGLDDEVVENACTAASSSESLVTPVNYNSPGQLVIAGHKAAVEEAMKACKEAGAKRALPLPVSAPFHTSLMKPAADRLANDVAKVAFRDAEIAVVQNVQSTPGQDAASIQSNLIEQIYSPVPWVSCVNQMVNEFGISSFVECGPGKVLSGLIKRIQKNTVQLDTSSESQFIETVNAVKGA